MNRILQHTPAVARVLLGLSFFVFGLNGFLNFLPMPPQEGAAGAFMGALAATGYMFPFIKGTEVLVGAALLSNRFVPLALTVLAPVTLNIVAFHVVLAPASLALPIFLVALQLYLAWSYRESFRALLTATAKPATAHASASGSELAAA